MDELDRNFSAINRLPPYIFEQINDFEKFISTWDKEQNLVFVTHYVVISEILNYTPLSGEIIISDKSLKVIDTLEIEY